MEQNALTLFRRIRILAVDDLAETRDLTREMLRAVGFHKVETARSGEDGYRKFILNPASLIVTDLRMAPMDGLAFTRMVRAAPDSPNRFVPIVVLSCLTDPETVHCARDAGANDFLAKPLRLETLRTHLAALIARPARFVRSPTYFGPDRRLHTQTRWSNERRQTMRQPGAPAPLLDRAHHAAVEQNALAGDIAGLA